MTYSFLQKFLGAGFGGGLRQRLRDSAFVGAFPGEGAD
jgi:hypothetical protein